MNNKKILGDHKLSDKKLITPFNAFASNGKFIETSHIKLIVPEIIWQAILNDKLGVNKTCELSLLLIKALEENKSSKPLCFISNFSNLDSQYVKNSIVKLSSQNIEIIIDALNILFRLFPNCPLKILQPNYNEKYTLDDVKYLKRILKPLLSKNNKEYILTLANTMLYIFETDRLKVPSGNSLLQLNEITYYPDTDLSRKIASTIRSSMNFFIGQKEFILECDWEKDFWRKAFEFEPYKIDDLYFE